MTRGSWDDQTPAGEKGLSAIKQPKKQKSSGLSSAALRLCTLPQVLRQTDD
jgi:hypothetical protein